jgi:glycosyltransferase involved in cell wall biosynthesis
LFEAELISRTVTYPSAKWFSHCHDNMIQMRQFSLSTLFKKSYFTNYYEKRYLFKRYTKNGGTHFLVISKHNQNYFNINQSKYRVSLLHNAINVERFKKNLNNKMYNELNTNFNVVNLKYTSNSKRKSVINSNNTLILINVGSFNLNKNQNFLLDIIVELNNRNKYINCFFLGDGSFRINVEKRAKELNILDQCIFKGNIENVEEYLWKSDVYVHVAFKEALGLTILEAMAAGLPVVTLDGGGNRDLIVNGKNGYLIEQQDPQLFADLILEVYQNQAISVFNIEYANKFDIESYCDKLLNIYNLPL